MEKLFNELGLNENLIEGLKKQGIESPTEIQLKAIPLGLANKDIIGESETGTGKTLAYLLPIFQKIDVSSKDIQAIILAPTHELAMQIHKQVELLSENSASLVKSTSIIGNVNIKRQLESLKEKTTHSSWISRKNFRTYIYEETKISWCKNHSNR